VAALVGSEADIRQAEVFHAMLAQRRAELCDLLDEYAIKLGCAEQSHDTAVVRRKRLRIKEIGAEIREIDRMMLGLRGHLLGLDRAQTSVSNPVNPAPPDTALSEISLPASANPRPRPRRPRVHSARAHCRATKIDVPAPRQSRDIRW
jgi:hypothetical protein